MSNLVTMHLDIFTLLVLLTTLFFLLGSVFMAVWLRTRNEPSMLWWSVSFFVRIPGLPLIMARGAIDDRLSIDLANVFILLGLGISWAGARKFSKQPIVPLVVIAPAIIWLIACQVPQIHAETGNRLFVISGLTALYSLGMAYEFWRERPQRPALRYSLAALFVFNSLINACRALYGLMFSLPHNFMQFDDWLATSFYLPLVLCIVGALVLVGLYRDRAAQLLKTKAELDPLTKVLNRGTFMDNATRALENGRRNQRSVALILFDLDHFKAVNDSYGHQAGDAVLVAFCALVRMCLRKRDLFGRIGGEEFAALLPGSDAETARQAAETIREAIDGFLIAHGDANISVTVSIGVAGAVAGESSFYDLMSSADQALYAAKRTGRNRVVLPPVGGEAVVRLPVLTPAEPVGRVATMRKAAARLVG